MTRTEDLLRSALEGAATPPTRIVDPLADLDRRVSRARRRLSITSAIAVFVVTAAVVVPLTLIGRGDSTPAVAGPRPTLATWAAGHVVAVAAGGGSIWSLEDHATRGADHADIVRRDPVTGAVEQQWIVSASYDFIAYGYGKVWVWGGGVSSAPESLAMTLNPATGARSARADLGRGNAFDSVIFVAGSAWAAAPERNRLLSFGFNAGASTTSVSRVRGIDSVVRLGGGGLLIVRRDGSVGPIPQQVGPVNASARIGAGVHPWARTAGSTFWVSSRDGDMYREDLARLSRIGSSVTLPQQPLGVVADASGGLYVALVNPSQTLAVPSLLYYSAAALGAASPRPTAIRHDGEVHRLTVDPAGGVVYTNSADALIHWTPAGPGLR